MADAAQLAYVRAGWLDATVEAKRVVGRDRVAVCVAANRGSKLTISELAFPGRKAIPQATLLAAMKGSEKTNRVGGVFDAGGFETDKIYLQAEYWERGYANVSVGEPRPVRKGNKLVVEIPIVEGPVFQLGQITTSHKIDAPIPLTSGELFGRKKIVSALERLRAQPGVEDVTPRTKVDVERRTIDITFQIQWRWPWHALSPWLSHS